MTIAIWQWQPCLAVLPDEDEPAAGVEAAHRPLQVSVVEDALQLDGLGVRVPHAAGGEDGDAPADEHAVPVEPPDGDEAVLGQVGALDRASALPQPVPEGAEELVAVLGVHSVMQ